MELKEAKLSDPVSDWLRARGYTPYAEVPWFSSPIDLVGKKDDHLIAVCLKVCLSDKVIRKAMAVQVQCHLVYCGVASKPRSSSLEKCKQHGIGVLRILGSQVDVLLEANDGSQPSENKHGCRIFSNYANLMVKKLEKLEPGGVGGKPNLKGEGPAQHAAHLIKQYRKTHPKATWKELFSNVPNHYASYQSMSNAMRMLPQRLAFNAWEQELKQMYRDAVAYLKEHVNASWEEIHSAVGHKLDNREMTLVYFRQLIREVEYRRKKKVFSTGRLGPFDWRTLL